MTSGAYPKSQQQRDRIRFGVKQTIADNRAAGRPVNQHPVTPDKSAKS